MSKINDGGPAFPVNGPNGNHPGMSLRDWFAGLAMAAIIAKRPPITDREGNAKGDAVIRASAVGAYDYADAMLAEREIES